MWVDLNRMSKTGWAFFFFKGASRFISFLFFSLNQIKHRFPTLIQERPYFDVLETWCMWCFNYFYFLTWLFWAVWGIDFSKTLLLWVCSSLSARTLATLHGFVAVCLHKYASYAEWINKVTNPIIDLSA